MSHGKPEAEGQYGNRKHDRHEVGGYRIRELLNGRAAGLRLTHQLHGTRFGTKNEAWDNEFMDRLEFEPAPLAELSTQEYMERGGTEGVEMIMWLAMRGALGRNVKRVHRNYTAPLTTGYGLLVLET